MPGTGQLFYVSKLVDQDKSLVFETRTQTVNNDNQCVVENPLDVCKGCKQEHVTSIREVIVKTMVLNTERKHAEVERQILDCGGMYTCSSCPRSIQLTPWQLGRKPHLHKFVEVQSRQFY